MNDIKDKSSSQEIWNQSICKFAFDFYFLLYSANFYPMVSHGLIIANCCYKKKKHGLYLLSDIAHNHIGSQYTDMS